MKTKLIDAHYIGNKTYVKLMQVKFDKNEWTTGLSLYYYIVLDNYNTIVLRLESNIPDIVLAHIKFKKHKDKLIKANG